MVTTTYHILLTTYHLLLTTYYLLLRRTGGYDGNDVSQIREIYECNPNFANNPFAVRATPPFTHNTTPHNTTQHHTTQLHTTPLHSSPHHTTQLHTTPLHSTALLTTHHNTTYHDHHITLITPRSTRHTQATIASGWSCPGGSTFSSTPAASVAAARAAGCSVLQCTSSSCRCCDVPVNAVRATGSTLYQVCAFTSKG